MPTDTVKVDPATGVGKPFNFDAAAWLSTRPTGESVEFEPLGESDVMRTADRRISALLQGEVPEEVLQQVEIRAAERAGQAGITGQMARNLTFRDLGANAMDAISAGLQSASQSEALRLEREKLNRTMELEGAKLSEEIRQANDRFAATMTQADLSSAGLALEAIKLQSANRQFRIAEENRLIISNSQQEIPGLQQNMNTLGESFLGFNRALQSFVELYS